MSQQKHERLNYDQVMVGLRQVATTMYEGGIILPDVPRRSLRAAVSQDFMTRTLVIMHLRFVIQELSGHMHTLHYGDPSDPSMFGKLEYGAHDYVLAIVPETFDTMDCLNIHAGNFDPRTMRLVVLRGDPVPGQPAIEYYRYADRYEPDGSMLEAP